LNWGYKTEPQSHLNNQQIDYSRGKGLGGSTAINFSCWVVGADEDYNEWARRVGDEVWEWRNVKERLRKIENCHVNVAEEHRKFVHPNPSGIVFRMSPDLCAFILLTFQIMARPDQSTSVLQIHLRKG
jgi:choline dehydrogenase-like flavoprotein